MSPDSLSRLLVATLFATTWFTTTAAWAEDDPGEDALLEDFLILDDGVAPQAASSARDLEELFLPDDDLSFDMAQPTGDGRTKKANKKKPGEGEADPNDFRLDGDLDPMEDFDLSSEPVEDFDMGLSGEGYEEEDLMGDPIEDFDMDPIDDPDGPMLGDLVDEPSPKAKPAPEPAPAKGSARDDGPGSIQLEVVGKKPLGDNYPATIVATDRDSVVVELPILLGRSRADFDGKPYWVVVEVWVDTKKVSESRQQVTVDGLAEFGPSFMFVKMLTPVPDAEGTLELRVLKAGGTGDAGQALFKRQVGYALR